MVEVFKTNVQEESAAREIVQLLLERFPMYAINFDLEDCDRVLRVEGSAIDSELICTIVEQANVQCCVL